MTAVDLPRPGRSVPAALTRGSLRRGRVALRLHPRSVLVGGVGIAATFVLLCVSISVGDFPIPLLDVFPAVLGFGNPDSDFIVRELRLPRALTGVLVGAAFGMSGAIFQAVARNPLASPDIIGIQQGAAAAAVAMIVLGSGAGPSVAAAALGGALVTATVAYLLARAGRTSPGYRLVLVGIGLGAMLSSVTQYLLTRGELIDVQRATVWLTGSLNGRGWEHVRPVGLALLVLAPLAVLLVRPLRAMELGDDSAAGLGVPVERVRALLVLAGVGLAAIAVSSAGPIGFVALVSPQIARRLTRAPGASLVPAAVIGAALTVSSDLVARRVLIIVNERFGWFTPAELPVGIVTAVLGAPFLLWLLARANKVGSAG